MCASAMSRWISGWITMRPSYGAAARRTAATATYLGGARCLLFRGRGQAEPGQLRGGLLARAHVELGQDRRDVVGNGLRGDVQARGDLGVGQPVREQLEDLDLARGQLPGV